MINKLTAQELFNQTKDYFLANENPDIVKKYSKYFKTGYDAYGVSQDLLQSYYKEIIADTGLTLDFYLETCRLLVETGKYEDTNLACLFVKKHSKQYSPAIFEEISHWFDIGINNWAHTDYICGEILSVFLIKSIVSLDSFAQWRFAKNSFKRRAVPVAMIKLMKTSKNYRQYYEFIEPMMLDPVREVQQGLGWFLREVWKKNPLETEEFLLKWKNRAPRLIYQYATEKMSKEQKERFRRDKS